MASLFDRSPRDISPDDLRAFLNEGHPESERLDYKLALESSIAESLVGMANGRGGILIAGVEEKDQLPVGWPGLGGKDWLDTLGNHNALECVPPVRYETAIVELPENSPKPLLIVRVPPSLRKPHMTRKKGILVRVDSQERPADLELIAGWFRPRDSSTPATSRPLGLLPHFVPGGTPTTDKSLRVSLLATPAYELVPLPMSETADRKIRELLISRVPRDWAIEMRGVTHVEFRTGSGEGGAYVRADGVSTLSWGWPTSGSLTRIPVGHILIIVSRALCYQLKVFRDVFLYLDDIRVQIEVANLNSAEFEWPDSVGTVRLAPLGQSAPGTSLQTTLRSSEDIESATTHVGMYMARDAQLIGYEPQVHGVMDLLRAHGSLASCD
jgi:Putative DNA-binding domain